MFMHCYYKNINPQTLAFTKAIAEVQWNLTYFGLETETFPSNFYSLAPYSTTIITLEEYNSKKFVSLLGLLIKLHYKILMSVIQTPEFFHDNTKNMEKITPHMACFLNFLPVSSTTKACKNTCCVKRVCSFVLITHPTKMVV